MSVFKTNLTTITEATATHDGVETVSKRHVDEAYRTLARAGLSRAVWYKRTEFETGVGGVFLALALSSSDIVAVFYPADSPWRSAITAAIFILALILGILLWIHGWLRGALLPPPAEPVGRRRWACWPWSRCRAAGESSCGTTTRRKQ